jgi:diguanylate cyclase (GGDEF)-like protein
MNAEDAFLELLVDTLEGLDRPARAQFLQRFLRSVAHVELTEELALHYWEQVLERRKELSESQGKAVSLKTALVSVMASADLLRLPVLMEYAELKQLRINAATDALTGLYNRRLFDEQFTRELNRAQRHAHPLALILLDLHRFKEVNDRHGHVQGDRVLEAAARTLWRSIRASDYAFRIGGDEFALLLPQADADDAHKLAQRVRANYEAAVLPMKLELLPAMDYGVAVYPQDGETKDVLIRVADERLYQMKGLPRQKPAVRREAPAERPAVSLRPEPTTRPPAGVERRRWERIVLSGTRAYAVLGEEGGRTARVLDLSYGGVALQMENPEQAPHLFQAVLHVPILPPVKVNLRKAYVRAEANGPRVGCAFVS